MIKLKKIYIQNFKGIHQPQILDFSSSHMMILDGPNGFGKTTIFDVIEICLRGRIERSVQYEYVTKKNQSHKKAFYQNTAGEAVTLKLWLYDETADVNHIIIRHLGQNHDGKIGNSKAFRPDSWDILQTYYTNVSESFDAEIALDKLTKIEQKEVDEIVLGNNALSLVNIYPLFHYLQQEENIYFLKKDEEEKKQELNFLFQTQNNAEDLENVDTFLKNIRANISQITERIGILGNVSDIENDIIYQSLFPEKNYAFDKEEPFIGVPTENLNDFYERTRVELDVIISFLENFSPEEYRKYNLRLSLNSVNERDALTYSFILNKFFPEDRFNELRIKKQKNDSYKKYLEQVSSHQVNPEILALAGFSAEYIAAFSDSILQKENLEKNVGDIGKIVIDLNLARAKVFTDYLLLNVSEAQPANCPLCNAEWESLNHLADAISEKTNALKIFNDSQATLLEELLRKVQTDYIDVIQQRISEILSLPENFLEDTFFISVTEYRGYAEIINRFLALMETSNIDFKEFIIEEVIPMERVESTRLNFKDKLAEVISSIVIDENKLINKELYKNLFEENEEPLRLLDLNEVKRKRDYIFKKFQNTKLLSVNTLNQRLLSLKKIEADVAILQGKLDKTIKKYKLDMIEKIKIPFYIYSGKILQNYQQGHGIFIDMQETTNRVRFLTDKNSDHDIIHHLSSGQLAVVSIAFSLALNKVYNTNDRFSFLAIDDPIQTMDDINIHSFIELMRHDFKKFQIVISTHEDDVAQYMLYKFQKFGFICERKNVQKLFYDSPQ